jgi:predicted nuclease of predicted toxin-antitoxin system
MLRITLQSLYVQILVLIFRKIKHTLQLLIVRQNEVSTEAVAKVYSLELEKGALLFEESNFVTQQRRDTKLWGGFHVY